MTTALAAMSPIGPRRTATAPMAAKAGSTCASSFTRESAVLFGIKKLAIFIRYLRRYGRAPALDRRFYLRLSGAISVESSDENPCHERTASAIGGNPAKALRRRLGNSSLCSCYIQLATQSMSL